MFMILVIVIGSLLCGLIPAYISKIKKKNFILWYLYGVIVFPAALIHSLLVFFGIKKGLNLFYTLLVFYALFVFYLLIWFFSTQPVAIAQEAIAKKRYAVAEKILNNSDSLSSKSESEIKKYLEKGAKVSPKQLNKILDGFDYSNIGDKEYLNEEMTNLLGSIEDNFRKTAGRASYEQWSVPKAEAAKIFKIYINSLKEINKINPDNIPLLEENYENILKTQSLYFGKADIAKEYLKHLDMERVKNNSIDRKFELIDKYELVGDTYRYVKQNKLSIGCYDAAISIYNEIIPEKEKEGENTRIYYKRIAVLEDKKGNLDAILKILDDFTETYFEEKQFSELSYYGDILDLFSLNTIEIKKNLPKAIDVFLNISTKYKSQYMDDVRHAENKLIKDVFPGLLDVDRIKYSEKLIDNYSYFLSQKSTDKSAGILENTKIIQETYLFFRNYKVLKQDKHSYYSQLVSLENKAKDLRDKVMSAETIEYKKDIQSDIDMVSNINFDKNNIISVKAEIKRLEDMKVEADNKASTITDKINDIKGVEDIFFSLQKIEYKISRKQIDKNEEEKENLDNFNKQINDESGKLKREICEKENSILTELLPGMTPLDKETFSSMINENYKIILTSIGTDTVSLIMKKSQVIQEAYNFFNKYKYDSFKASLLNQLELIYKSYMATIERNIIEGEFSNFERTSRYANKKTKNKYIEQGNKILEEIGNFKTTGDIIKILLGKEVKMDKINNAESKIKEILVKLNKK